jgi:hypothetical protein|tara:strand:- start:175 stop:708 length:534 start_codon:yes stop_codon:yes gene_type:complete
MAGPSTNINDIINDNKRLSNDDANMVDSIINDLNSNSASTSQETMPQITDEERQALMKQREIQQQEQRHYQMQQQQKQIQNQQMQQQQEMINMYSQISEPDVPLDQKIKDYFFKSMDIIAVLFLSILFNVPSISEVLKFKSLPFLYDIETETSTTASIILKGLTIAFTFAIIKYFIK